MTSTITFLLRFPALLFIVLVVPHHPIAAQSLPAGWASADIGLVGAVGQADGSGGAFTVRGSGDDIWNTADAFHFAYVPLSGDGAIIARVASLQRTHHWAKAGVMMRETMAAGSRHASMFVSPERGLAFQRRTSTGGVSTHTPGPLEAPPYWVRMARNGHVFTAQSSADGVSWRTIGTERITMSGTIYVGLAVTSHAAGVVATAQFEQVAVTSGISGGVTLARQPYLQQVTSTSAIVVWATFEGTAGAVRYNVPGGPQATVAATSTHYPVSTTGLPYDIYQHEARLWSLSPATTYEYEVRAGGVAAFDGRDRLRTAPGPGGGTVRFIAFGDSGTGSAEQRRLAALMEQEAFDLSLHTGDVVYGSSSGVGDASFRTFNDWFFLVYERWLRRAPMFPSLGNHDSRASTQHGFAYLETFVLPDNGASGPYPDHAERFYSFDFGPVHFVALDTELAFSDPARRADQLAWLEADLAATAQPWKIAYFHRTPYSAGAHHGSDLAVRAAFTPIFERHGVQLVLAAHEHLYERTHPMPFDRPSNEQVVYITTGGGGAPVYPAGTAAWTAHIASVHHYVRAEATACALALEAVGLAGTVFDSITLERCGGADVTPPQVTWTSPAAGAQVSGTIQVSVNAQDNVGVTRVDFRLNGAIAATRTTAPYTFLWDTTTVGDGQHVLEVRAHDAAGNTGSSGPRTVTVSNAASPPATWLSRDVGSVGIAGAASIAGNAFTLSASGLDIWDTADGFHFVFQALEGDGEIVARVASLQGSHHWAKAGVMIREALTAGSRHAFMLVSRDRGLAFQRRVSTNGISTHTDGGAGRAPAWVRLVRSGSTFQAYRSADGSNWTLVGSQAISMGAVVYAGLALTSHDNGSLATAAFDAVRLVQTADGWSNRDIGTVGRAGHAAEQHGVFTLEGSGADIWDTADGFHFLHRTLAGDGEVVARVASLQGSHHWAKAGVMIRETLSAGSRHAFMLVSRDRGLAFQRRVSTNGISTHTDAGAGGAPNWVRLVRSGSTVLAYRSADGTTWTLVGSQSIPMDASVYVGLALTSHDNTSLARATFDGVLVR
jgi:regulation of enolase protein 1 (concanavalin A-like superfamily)